MTYHKRKVIFGKLQILLPLFQKKRKPGGRGMLIETQIFQNNAINFGVNLIAWSLWVHHVDNRELKQRRRRPLVENEVIFYQRNSQLLDLHSNQMTLKTCSGWNIQWVLKLNTQRWRSIPIGNTKITRGRPRSIYIQSFREICFLSQNANEYLTETGSLHCTL